jgi:hypothetical protein
VTIASHRRASRAFGLIGVGAAAMMISGACDAPRATVCPGERVASLSFRAEPTVVDPATGGAPCAFALDAGVSFGGTVSYLGETEALLCLDRPEATPLSGSRIGNRITVTAPKVPTTLPQCGTCALLVTESIEGDVAPETEAVGFDGGLRNVLELASGTDPASCGGDGGAQCGAPCELRWTLIGSR